MAKKMVKKYIYLVMIIGCLGFGIFRTRIHETIGRNAMLTIRLFEHLTNIRPHNPATGRALRPALGGVWRSVNYGNTQARQQISPAGDKQKNSTQLTNTNAEALPATNAIHEQTNAGKDAHSIRKIISDETSLTDHEIEIIKSKIEQINDLQQISNLEKYGPILSNTTIVLIQVHNRVGHLHLLISSLESAKYINESLVIFSHDIWLPEINEVVANITQFRTLQMFFPFSVQLHPRVFPGLDPRDCQRDYVKDRSIKKRFCLNEDWPDTYGHYREPRFTQLKHHWWWKLYRVFEGLHVTRDYAGDVLFLEDDYYVAPDVLHALRMLRASPASRGSLLLSLGNFLPYDPHQANQVMRGSCEGFTKVLGFAVNSASWQTLKKLGAPYCTNDDYNYDWTMTNIINQDPNLRGRFLCLALRRVHSLGFCSGTHKVQDCSLPKMVRDVKDRIAMSAQYFFPPSLTVGSEHTSQVWSPTFGGWGDYRDQELCKAIANGTASQQTLDTLQYLDVVL